MMKTTLLSFMLLAACTTGSSTDSTELSAAQNQPCPTCRVCAIATLDTPAYAAQNFDTAEEAKLWLDSFGDTVLKEVVDGPCDAPIACPDVFSPVCGVVSGGEQTTYANGCELLAAVRQAAGSSSGGEGKGEQLHGGTCEGACAGKACGEPCDSPFGNPLPTYCDAAGACGIGVPACPPPLFYDCDQTHAVCDRIPPTCAKGFAPSIIDGCYGDCVPVAQCDPTVPPTSSTTL